MAGLFPGIWKHILRLWCWELPCWHWILPLQHLRPYRLSIEEYRQWENRLIRPEFYGNAQINVHGGRQHSATIVDSVTQEKFEGRQLFDEPNAGQLQSPITA